MISVRTAIVGIGLGLAAAVSTGVSAEQPGGGARAGGELKVTVHYKGRGPVGKGHEIGIFLFDKPDFGGAYKPVGVKVLETNGGTAHFTGLTSPTVYVAVSYDTTGTYLELKGPPPPGAPVAVYGVKGDPNVIFERGAIERPAGVSPGPDARVTITFDDAYPSK